MKHNLTNAQISVLYEGIQAFINSPDLNMKAIDKVHMLRNKNTLESLYNAFNEVRRELIIKHGDLNEESTEYKLTDPEKVNAFIEEITPVINETIKDIDLFHININAIDDKVDIKTIESLLEIIDDEVTTSSDIKE